MRGGIDLDGAVVVLTGASSGIGKAVALELAGRGARLVLAARRADALAEVATECRALGADAITVPTDVTDAVAVSQLARRAVERYGRIDAWVNDAGQYLLGLFDDVPIESHRRIIETNLVGVMHGSRAAIEQLRRQGRGVLVNVASQAGKGGYRYAASYCASKFGVRGFTEALRQDLLGSGVAVCCVLPAAVDTPLFEHAANYTGRKMRPLSPVYSVERVAHAIVDCLEHPRREVVIGAAPRLLGLIHLLSQSLFERLHARMADRGHFEDRPAPRTSGNLFEPRGSTETSGGWKHSSSRKLGWAALGLVGAGLLGGAIWQRDRIRQALTA